MPHDTRSEYLNLYRSHRKAACKAIRAREHGNAREHARIAGTYLALAQTMPARNANVEG